MVLQVILATFHIGSRWALLLSANYRVPQKTSFCENWPWQILLLAVRNPYWTFANTSKIPKPTLTSSKCVGTCDEFVSNCLVVFQAWCCIDIISFAIVRYVTQPDDEHMNYKMNHLHLSWKIIVDFSLSTVIFAMANFDKRKFFLRHRDTLY